MNLSDWLLIAQLIVLAGTLIVVVWYTFETREIRLGTTSQAVLTPNAKIWDRQNDIDRLLFLHPNVAKEFDKMANHKGEYFNAPPEEVPRGELYYQLKELVYLQLNFFEEIYTTTTSSSAVAGQFKREAWHEFIFLSMDHALLREVFYTEMGRTYTGEFVQFMIMEENKWKGHAEDNE